MHINYNCQEMYQNVNSFSLDSGITDDFYSLPFANLHFQEYIQIFFILSIKKS